MSMTECQVQDLKWEELRQFPGTGEVKVLRDTPESGAKTMIVKLPPGGRVEPHSHPAVVQHYVLEGEYEQQGKTYARGAYRMLPQHADMSEITTGQGATVLMIYDPSYETSEKGSKE